MKQFALASLLSSLLVAAVSLGYFFVWQKMDTSSFRVFWFLAFLSSPPLLVLVFLPAAILPSTLFRSAISAALASCVGTFFAILTVDFYLWGSPVNIGSYGKEFFVQIQSLLWPAAIAFAIGAVWRNWRRRRAPQAAADA